MPELCQGVSHAVGNGDKAMGKAEAKALRKRYEEAQGLLATREGQQATKSWTRSRLSGCLEAGCEAETRGASAWLEDGCKDGKRDPRRGLVGAG